MQDLHLERQPIVTIDTTPFQKHIDGTEIGITQRKLQDTLL